MNSPPSNMLAALVATATLLAACGGSTDPESIDPLRAEVLKRGNGGEPESLDPALAEDVHAFNVLLDLYEGLVALDADGSAIPGASVGWTVSEDGRLWRFDLRRDATWSNGEPLLAQHFVDGIHHVVGPESRSPTAFLLDVLENFEGVMKGDLPPNALGVDAPDKFTVQFRLARPAPYFAGILAMPVAYPRLLDIHADPAAFKSAGQFVGNGAYVLDEWQVGSHVRLKRNELFHSAGDVPIKTVEYLAIEDPVREYNLYRTGELDITNSIGPTAFADIKATRPDEVSVSPGLAVYYLAPDLSEPPMNVRELRKALSMAVDRNQLVKLLGRGEVAAFNLVPPGVSDYETAEYDWKDMPDEARENASRVAYSAAGYSKESPLKITLTYDAGDIHEKVALAVSSMWHEILGVEVTLEKLEWKLFLDTREQRSTWEIMRFSWFGDFDDPINFVGLFTSTSLQNLPGYRNAHFDSLLQLADVQEDPAKRKSQMHEAETIFLEDYPIIPLYFPVNKHLVSPRVLGFVPNSMDRHASRTLKLR